MYDGAPQLGDHHGYLLRMRMEGGLEGIELGPLLGKARSPPPPRASGCSLRRHRDRGGLLRVSRRFVVCVPGDTWQRGETLCSRWYM